MKNLNGKTRILIRAIKAEIIVHPQLVKNIVERAFMENLNGKTRILTRAINAEIIARPQLVKNIVERKSMECSLEEKSPLIPLKSLRNTKERSIECLEHGLKKK